MARSTYNYNLQGIALQRTDFGEERGCAIHHPAHQGGGNADRARDEGLSDQLLGLQGYFPERGVGCVRCDAAGGRVRLRSDEGLRGGPLPRFLGLREVHTPERARSLWADVASTQLRYHDQGICSYFPVLKSISLLF